MFLKTSVALITSTDMIPSLASMTSTASLASKIKSCLHFTYWVISLVSGTSAARMTSTASTASMASVALMTSTASFPQKTYWAWCFHQPWHQNGRSMWKESSKIHYFFEFWTSFRTEAVEDRDVIFNQIQGSTVKCPLPMNIQIPFIWHILIWKTL